MKRQLRVQQNPIQIVEISSKDYGNPLIARGTFGEITIAIQIPTTTATATTENDTTTTTEIPNSSPPSYVAMKTIRNAVIYNHTKSSHEFTPAVFTELSALRALTPHPNITPLLGIKYNASDNDNDDNKNTSTSVLFSSTSFSSLSSMNSLSFIFPYCPMDLQDIITHRRKQNQHIPKAIIQSIIYDICTGLEYCHSKGIIHCDIKPGNIVLSSNGIFQLADFGIARIYIPKLQKVIKQNDNDSIEKQNQSLQQDNMVQQYHPTRHQLGLCTLYYRPPELLYGSTNFQPSVDMWGVGLIITELCTLRPLFPGCSVLDQLSRIMDVLGTPNIDTYAKLDSLPDYDKIKFDERDGIGLEQVVPSMQVDLDLASIVKRLVLMNPEDRLLASECLNHRFLHSSLHNDCLGCGCDDDNKGMSTAFILKTLIFNDQVLAHDNNMLSKSISLSSSSIIDLKDISLSEESIEETMEEMKLKGVSIAQARRKLSSFGNFDFEKEKAKSKKASTQSGLPSILAAKMASGGSALKEVLAYTNKSKVSSII